MCNFSFMLVLFAAGLANAFAEQPAAEQPKGAKELIEEQLKTAEADRAEAQEKVNKKDEEIKLYEHALGKNSQFSEFGFGLGFGNVFLRGLGHIDAAVVDQGVVRITDQEKNKLGVWLTTSWINDQWPRSWAWVGFGPFVGVQLGGTDDIVDSLAVGVAVSFKKIAPALPLDFQFGWGWDSHQFLVGRVCRGRRGTAGCLAGPTEKERRQRTSPDRFLQVPRQQTVTFGNTHERDAQNSASRSCTPKALSFL
jgi:hypothetical protein